MRHGVLRSLMVRRKLHVEVVEEASSVWDAGCMDGVSRKLVEYPL